MGCRAHLAAGADVDGSMGHVWDPRNWRSAPVALVPSPGQEPLEGPGTASHWACAAAWGGDWMGVQVAHGELPKLLACRIAPHYSQAACPHSYHTGQAIAPCS